MRKQIDLTTLPGWANLSTGNHTIKIKAKGTGYIDSELSAGVVVSKAPSTVTLEAGTYKFVNSPTKQNIQQDIVFTSFNTNYIEIAMYESTNRIMYSSEEGPGIVYNGTWTKTAWQTITLSTAQTVSAEFYKWAITDGNLVKQITDLTGTKWKFNSSYTKVGQDAQYWFNIIGKLTLNDTDVIENSSSNPYIWVRTSDVENWTMFCVNNTQNTWSTVYPYANARGQYNDIFYEYKSGSYYSYPRATTSIVLEIYSGSDTTNSTFIEWLKANATLIK